MQTKLIHVLATMMAIVGSSTLFASQLTITNTANHDITVTINGVCSHEYGLIKSMTNHSVDDATLARLCKNQSGHCLAQLYNSTICRDNLIAIFYFNTSKGTSGEGATVQPYHLSFKPFEAILSMN